MSLCPTTKGNLTRAELTKIFYDYVYAYMYVAHIRQPLVPTILFVLTRIDGTSERPITVPYSTAIYTPDSSDGFVSLLIETYPPGVYRLEMVVYSRFDTDFDIKSHYKIMFGAIDYWGATVHSLYDYDGRGKRDTVKHRKIPGNLFDQWMPAKTGFNDKFLREVVATYQTLVSLNNVELHAK